MQDLHQTQTGLETQSKSILKYFRIAISFVLNYEEGGEHSFLNGDSHSEVFLNETPGSAPKVGM